MSPAKTRIVFGGNRSSKTFTCMKEVVFNACLKAHPFTGQVFREGGRRGRLFAQDYALHEKRTLPDLYEWIPKRSLAYGKAEETLRMAFDRSYDSRNHILHLVKDSTIDLLTYDQDPSKGESVDLDFAYADEEMPEDWYGATVARLVTRDGRFWMGVTPLYGLTWGMKFLDTVNPDVEVFTWEIWDNPHNSKEAIDKFIAEIPEHEREARVYGKFLELQGLVFKELDRQVHLIDYKAPEAGCPVIMAMDPHQRKATVITWAYVTQQEDVVFFDELEASGTASEVVAAIKQKEASHGARTTLRLIDPASNKQVSGFGSEVTTLREFEREGMGFSLADNSEAGYNVIHEYLAYDKSKPLSTLNRPKLYITKNCQKTWFGMSHLLWDEWRFGEMREKKERVRDWKKDFPDCVRYTVVGRPQYNQNYQPVKYRMGIKPVLQQDNSFISELVRDMRRSALNGRP